MTDPSVGPTTPTRLVIVDDAEVVRIGLDTLFAAVPDITLVAAAASVAEGEQVMGDARPDVVLLDVVLPDGDGINLCRTLRHRLPDLACILFSDFVDQQALAEADFAGAVAYLSKDVAGHVLVDAIRQAAGSSRVELGQANHLQAPTELDAERSLAILSVQERRVTHLIADGMTNDEIAEELGLSSRTVKNYVSRLMAKLGMRRRTQVLALVARARHERLMARLPPPRPHQAADVPIPAELRRDR